MLSVNKYSQKYVNQTRARLEPDVAAFNALDDSLEGEDGDEIRLRAADFRRWRTAS